MTSKYLFKSERLGFRTWSNNDLEPMTSINSDAEVMQFFPKTQTQDDTANFIKRMQKSYAENGFCYFAVELLSTGEFIGFIGLSIQTFEADFTPITDIGWRLSKNTWGKGFATEGAKRCLTYAFDNLKLDKVLSTSPIINTPSINIMEKIGMLKVKEFEHPLLLNNEKLKKCVLYRIDRFTSPLE